MNKKISLNEHINTIKKRINYINESPIYNKFDGEEYDEIPNGIFEAGDEDLPPDKLKVPTNSSDKGASETTAADAELPPAEGNGVPVPDINQGDLPPVGGDVPMPQPVEQTPDVDEIQNDIIKHNLLAIKDIHAQLSNLNSLADSLNNKLDIIAKDVDEVREPTNGEKLMSKTRVSYPFYLNLNDNWKDNWFEQNSKNNTDKGIVKLPDGTYIADFDDLPKSSSTDILNSF
jgi:hypothetical protein